MTAYKKLTDWNTKKDDRFVDEYGDFLICASDKTAHWHGHWPPLPFDEFDEFEFDRVKPINEPIDTITNGSKPRTSNDYAPLRALPVQS